MKLWGMEPALIIGTITALIATAVAFGVPVSNEQEEAIKGLANMVIILFGAFMTRRQVISTQKVDAAFGEGASKEASAIAKASRE